MTTFTVYGVTRTRATKLARSALQQRHCVYEKTAPIVENQMAEETRVQIEMSELAKVGPLLSTPQFCQDWIDLAYKQYPNEYYRLSIYQHVPKLNRAGNEITRKNSMKPIMTWSPYESSDRM